MIASDAITNFAFPVLTAIAVAMARALGLLAISPAFTRLGLTNLLRSATAFAISLPLANALLAHGVFEAQTGAFVITAILLKEFVIGMALGLFYGVPFWAAEIAGDFIDLQRGSTAGQLVDPSNFSESSVTATLLTVASITIFFISGGFHAMLEGFYKSYEIWPVQSLTPVFSANLVSFIFGMLDKVVYYSLILAFPVLASTLLCDIVLSYLARSAPQMHIFDMSLSVKAIVFSVVIVLYSNYFSYYLRDMIRDLDTRIELIAAPAVPRETR
jgi:type III secretion protein T